MSTIEEVNAAVQEVSDTIDLMDSKLDEIRAFIATLQPGPVTQAQLDQLAAMVDAVKVHSTAVLAETDALDDPQP